MMTREIPRPRQSICNSDEEAGTFSSSCYLHGKSLSSTELLASSWRFVRPRQLTCIYDTVRTISTG
jgi:hypothetical protein